jgi:hypothetical protein
MTDFTISAPNNTEYRYTVSGDDTYDFVKLRNGKILVCEEVPATSAAGMRRMAASKHWPIFSAR